MSSTIQDLIDEGVLQIYHDYRSGCAYDWSGNGNHGTINSNVQWGGGGLQFNSSTDARVTVSDAAGLQLTEGTLIAFGDFKSQTTSERFLQKRDAGGVNYDFYTDGANVILEGTAARTVVTNILGKRYIAVNFKNGETIDVFIDGISVGSSGATLSATTDDANVSIGNSYNVSGNNLKSPLHGILIINRNLTATEHAQLFSELQNTTWPSKPKVRDANDNDGDVRFASTWNAKEITGLTAGYQVPGTPFYADSGTFAVSYETVDGELCKVLECTSDGICYISTQEFLGDQDDDAYGTWEWWCYKTDSGEMGFMFVASDIDSLTGASQLGYAVRYAVSEAINAFEMTGGAVATKWTSSGTYTHSTWHKIKITRETDGETTGYVDDVLITAATGSNPFTDASVTSSQYLVFDVDAGDKICFGSIRGKNAITFKKGVV